MISYSPIFNISDDDVKVDVFKYGEITEVEYGSRKKGILHTNCTNPMLNVILCEMEEKDMSYTLLDRFEFFHVSNCIYLLISFFKKKKKMTYIQSGLIQL